MRFRSLTSAIAAAALAMVMMTGTVQAAEAAKYPDWKGAWTRWFPPGSVLEPNGGFTAGGQAACTTNMFEFEFPTRTTCALNERGVRPARGTRWYASSLANLLSRVQKLAEIASTPLQSESQLVL
jgi:hypothetical protein